MLAARSQLPAELPEASPSPPTPARRRPQGRECRSAYSYNNIRRTRNRRISAHQRCKSLFLGQPRPHQAVKPDANWGHFGGKSALRFPCYPEQGALDHPARELPCESASMRQCPGNSEPNLPRGSEEQLRSMGRSQLRSRQPFEQPYGSRSSSLPLVESSARSPGSRSAPEPLR